MGLIRSLARKGEKWIKAVLLLQLQAGCGRSRFLNQFALWRWGFLVHEILGVRPPTKRIDPGTDSQDLMDQVMNVAFKDDDPVNLVNEINGRSPRAAGGRVAPATVCAIGCANRRQSYPITVNAVGRADPA
ncbi:MAG: hypothetical protein R3F54_02140 [Alphaproteobacteria bacterium]